MPLPTKNKAYSFPVQLRDKLDLTVFKINPTLAVGDVKISLDYADFVNLTTLPVVDPANTSNVKVTVSTAEMNGEKAVISFLDVTGDEWEELTAFIDIPNGTVETLITGVIRAGETGSIPFRMLDVYDNPVGNVPVNVLKKLDAGTFGSVEGTVTDTDSRGASLFTYTGNDVNGTEAVMFEFTAQGAKATYMMFKLTDK